MPDLYCTYGQLNYLPHVNPTIEVMTPFNPSVRGSTLDKKCDTLPHKVLTYVEYRAVSGVFQNIDPPPPLHPASMSSPAPKAGGGGYTLAGR